MYVDFRINGFEDGFWILNNTINRELEKQRVPTQEEAASKVFLEIL